MPAFWSQPADPPAVGCCVPAVEGLLTLTCFQLLGRKEGLYSQPSHPTLPTAPLQSVLSSNGTVYTFTSDTPFHLPRHTVSLRVIAVNTVYTP